MPEKPFVINDRRKFTAEGDIRPEAQASTAAASAEPETAQDTEPGRSSSEPGKPSREPIAFPTSTPKAPAPEPGRSEDEPDFDEPPAAARTHEARTHETIAFPSPAGQQSAGPEANSDLQEGKGDEFDEASLPPLTAEQSEQASRAYSATVDRLDTAMRANNLGAEPLPEMTFERLVQSLYMQSLLQLGGATEPGQPPRVDILGARQTIDMLAIVAEKSRGNLSDAEDKFLQSALFEIRMGFLEVTQALARQAATRQPAGPGGMPGAGPGFGPGAKGPGIVR